MSPSSSRLRSARVHRGLATAALLCASVVWAAGCLVNSDSRCGDNQEYDGERCVCASGYGLVGRDCVKCGRHEVGSLAGCACDEGYARRSDDGPCVERPAGDLGSECESDDDCTQEAYPHCQSAGDDGYCTSRDCASSEQCETGQDYACNTRKSPSFCERPARGLGTSCDSSDECADFEASFCEALSSHVCLVGDCKADPEVCHGDWECCDIPVLGTSICVPPSELTEGECPAGGTLIERSR